MLGLFSSSSSTTTAVNDNRVNNEAGGGVLAAENASINQTTPEAWDFGDNIANQLFAYVQDTTADLFNAIGENLDVAKQNTQISSNNATEAFKFAQQQSQFELTTIIERAGPWLVGVVATWMVGKALTKWVGE